MSNADTGIGQPRVCVLMSVYNGASYISEQLESIAGQTDVFVFVHARDDGSGDNSPDLLNEYCEAKDLPHRLMTGENIGASKSFLTLIYDADQTFDFYALADQDDVWLEEKLRRAAAYLAPYVDTPALYISRQFLTDATLNVFGLSDVPRKIGFGNALVQNIATGCASVFNLAALKLLQSLSMPSGRTFHDHWIYQVVSSAGSVLYDPQPMVLYRQHGKNAVGYETRFFPKWKKRLRNYLAGNRHAMAEELIDRAGPCLKEHDRRLAELLMSSRSSFRSRLQLFFGGAVWRQKTVDDLIMRVLILLGKFG